MAQIGRIKKAKLDKHKSIRVERGIKKLLKKIAREVARNER